MIDSLGRSMLNSSAVNDDNINRDCEVESDTAVLEEH
jgi:hypothetical protein